MATRAGFTDFTTCQDPDELIERSGNDGWDLVVDCALGSKPLDFTLRIVRRGGTIVVIGGAPDSDKLQIPANIFVMRDLHIEGIFGYTTESWVRTLELLTTGQLVLGDLISHRKRIEEFDQAVGLLQSRTEPMGKVIISYLSEPRL
jgi:threonine dehydrogenase-like Zn-dependent dehydrogenase